MQDCRCEDGAGLRVNAARPGKENQIRFGPFCHILHVRLPEAAKVIWGQLGCRWLVPDHVHTLSRFLGFLLILLVIDDPSIMSRPSSSDENEKATVVDTPPVKAKGGFFSRKKDATNGLSVEDEKAAASGDATTEVRDAKEDNVTPVSMAQLYRYVLVGGS